MADLKRFEREERAFNTHREHRMAICATLYQSLSLDIQNRVNEDPAAIQYKARGEAASLWKFIKEVIQGVEYSDAMTHFTNLCHFKTESPDSMVSHYTKFVDSIDAIKSRYPANGDKVRLCLEFKTHRYVQSLKDHEEF